MALEMLQRDNFAMNTSNETVVLETEEHVHFPRPVTIFAAAASIVFVVIGVVGNVLVI